MTKCNTVSINATTTLTDIATFTANVSMVSTVVFANKTSSPVTINLAVAYAANTSVNYYINNTMTVPATSGLSGLPDRLYMQVGDKIKASASANSAVDVTVSWIELP